MPQNVHPEVAAIAEEAPEDVLEAAQAKDDPVRVLSVPGLGAAVECSRLRISKTCFKWQRKLRNPHGPAPVPLLSSLLRSDACWRASRISACWRSPSF